MSKHEPISLPLPAPAIGLPNPIQPMPASPPAMSDAPHEEKGAYKKGADAEKQDKEEAKNPYPEGSSRAKAYEHGRLDAQKIRSNDKPPPK